jgi:hypothetical protein
MASYWRPNRLPEGTALGAMGPAMENCGRIDRRIAARARLPQPSQTHWRERVGAPLCGRPPVGAPPSARCSLETSTVAIFKPIAARARLPQPKQTHWRERVGGPLWERRPRRDAASKQAQWPFSSHRREGAAPTPASQAALLAVGGSRFHPLSLWERVWAKVDRDTAALS